MTITVKKAYSIYIARFQILMYNEQDVFITIDTEGENLCQELKVLKEL